jgi:oxepin-CoA hydrolase/3-oxo-5,6-dehydrosuberyl-CoA semialdehyde dehydrogenase
MVTIPFDVNDTALREVFLREMLLTALAPLSESDRPRWGKMSAQQMVEHLVWAFELSTGRAQAECRVLPEERERIQRFLDDNRPSPHEFMNPALVAGLPPLRWTGVVEARVALSVEVGHFLEQSRTHPGATHTHPLFGPIGVEQWSRTHFKHGYHHLLQFGLVDVGSNLA